MVQAIQETGLTTFPATCPWATGQILALDWMPS
jgi:hypothetical protein